MAFPMVGGPFASPHTVSPFSDATNDNNFPSNNPAKLNPSHEMIAAVRHYNGQPTTTGQLPAGRLYADPAGVAKQINEVGDGINGTPQRAAASPSSAANARFGLVGAKY
eukprot:GDKK01050767.1.p1 GENE.GDKK01050767.1~~GDKK01050767.1.p1  ORF type:complete len:125 (-),score=9.97 GDKK01050767.1:35-361(-)